MCSEGDLPLSPSLMMQPLLTPCQIVLTSAQTPGPSPPCLFLISFSSFIAVGFFPPLHEIQMPSLEACRALSGPNKSE